MDIKTHTLDTAEADIVDDVEGPLPTADGRPPLFMIGQPMDASGFRTLASYVPDRTVITHGRRRLSSQHSRAMARYRSLGGGDAARRRRACAQPGPAAVAALRKAWERGNAAGAIEVLKALGFLKPPPTARPTNIAIERDLDAEIERLLGKARPDNPA